MPEDRVILAQGKTKIIYADPENPDCVIVKNKAAITAHDDPSLTRQFEKKAEYATETTCRVFELAQACGVSVSYLGQIDATSFRAHRSDMVPLEIIRRRLAVGSFLMRHPELYTDDPKKPHRFHALCRELFLKTTGRKFGDLLTGLPCDDPFIADPQEDPWRLFDPKTPLWQFEGKKVGPASSIGQVRQIDVLPMDFDLESVEKNIDSLFYVLEKAWANLGLTLVDFKVEVDSFGAISDVVDNDSWRLWKNGEAFDKQVFRDGGEAVLDEVERKYGFIAEMAKRLALPKQALVCWRGSSSDQSFDNPHVPGVEFLDVVCSGHKQTKFCLDRLENIQAEYPQGGVIVAAVGRSNGLGPILAAHSSWPVIAVPLDYADHPEDVHSSLSMPSQVPLSTAWPASNACLAAIRILGQTNPAAYARERAVIESQESYLV